MVEIISHTNEPERTIYTAGRTTIGRHSDTADSVVIGRWIRSRINEGHYSVLEHASITYLVTDISRACSHQLVRHRIASYTMQSQRYCKERNPRFISPTLDDDAHMILDGAYKHSNDAYKVLLSLGVKPEDARFVLPQATPTTIAVTMNFRALREFLQKRLDKHAQWEIRQVAQDMLSLALTIAPNVFEDVKQ